MSGHINLLLRSRRVQVCVALALLGIFAVALVAGAPFLSITAKLMIVSAVILGATLLMSIIVARMIGLSFDGLSPPPTLSNNRLANLALQLQSSDINVARLPAKLERLEFGQRPQTAAAMEQIAQRLNALENALETTDSSSPARVNSAIDQVKSGVAKLVDRLVKLENADRALIKFEKRLQLIEDQLESHAQNVERLTRANV